MPKTKPFTALGGVKPLLSDQKPGFTPSLLKKTKPPKPKPGKIGGKPPRFPGRAGGR